MSDRLISELVSYDEYGVLKEQLDVSKITEDVMTQQDLSDSEDDNKGSTVDAFTEALYEKKVPSHDTFMYHVNELCLEEQTVTNGIAKFIDLKEKNNSKLMEDLRLNFILILKIIFLNPTQMQKTMSAVRKTKK